MQSYLKILIGVGVLTYYIIRMVQKQKVKQSKTLVPNRKPFFENRATNEDDSAIKNEYKLRRETNSEPIVRNKPASGARINPIQTDSVNLDEEHLEDEIHPILKDFDPQKAVIYSEILKPPYL